ncbi:unnamed protein product [Nezara viridula]|uniref:Fatty acyl-CoA reductase n=1 Tax=Nezara viridula TaxID=85310 RepID=A0A9P0MGV3_NEZVI|nr:unnamed protein product [Nezara viridula]
MITIKEYFNNKTILITGGAGFFGKVLTEKLLRTCPGVKRIYLIIRPKRGKTPQERWDEIAKDVLFETVLNETPDIMNQKVTVLDGDMSLKNLGLSQEIIKELQNTVNIIFHSAATVRFNDPLHKAFLSNTRGTLEMCKLATQMNNFEWVRLKVGNACYFSVTKLLSSRLLSRNLKIRIYKTIVLPTVLYGCETWPLTIRDEQRLKKDELTGDFRRLHNAELRELYPGNIIEVISSRRIKWAFKIVGLSNERIPKRLIFAVPNGKRPRGRPKRRWEDCIKADLKGLGLEGERENKELSVYNCSYGDILPITFNDMHDLGVETHEYGTAS